MQRSAPVSTQEAAKPRFTIADIERELPGLPKGFTARLPAILALEPATWGGSSGTTAEGTDEDRAQIREAVALVRRSRGVSLGMPRVRQPLPDLRPERTG